MGSNPTPSADQPGRAATCWTVCRLLLKLSCDPPAILSFCTLATAGELEEKTAAARSAVAEAEEAGICDVFTEI